jgi:hypothetical protein
MPIAPSISWAAKPMTTESRKSAGNTGLRPLRATPGGKLRAFGRFRLAVSFQQVVHPVLSEEAGVAKLQRFLGGPDEHP